MPPRSGAYFETNNLDIIWCLLMKVIKHNLELSVESSMNNRDSCALWSFINCPVELDKSVNRLNLFVVRYTARYR